MTSLAPLQYKTEIVETDQFDRPTETFSRCSLNDGQLPYILALIVLNLGCLIYAILQSYRARHLTTEFSESEYVFKALLTSLLAVVIGVPVLMLARHNANASVFVESIILCVTSNSTLLYIFIPKILYSKQTENQDDRFRAALSSIVRKAAGSDRSDSKQGVRRHSGSDSSIQFGSDGSLVSASQATELSSSPKRGIKVLEVKTKEELAIQNKALKIENARLRRQVLHWTSSVGESSPRRETRRSTCPSTGIPEETTRAWASSLSDSLQLEETLTTDPENSSQGQIGVE
eukprot:CAMPEP_0176006070 /NCGR_PEP_ID=MMETSP0120_2-20121206/2532_1 /TAXON_ID=160619 /ORGANISM="Kryptoperidinium foliaceum, Strain CCMP 1326" /LENGTH=288 /DNA_ID=CAMNT_0017338797 /DNA_START=391 /DNA_END=1257 /DNA_ORIENTATION=-